MFTSGWAQEIPPEGHGPRLEVTRTVVKPMEESDFLLMHDALWAVKKTQSDLGLPLPNRTRLWEWASGVDALTSVVGERLEHEEIRVLDVNPRGALLGTTLAYIYGMTVIEYESDEKCRAARFEINKRLERAGKKTLRVEAGELPLVEIYDAVLATDMQSYGAVTWLSLARRVKRGGMMYVTVNLEKVLPSVLIDRVAMCRAEGLVAMGKPRFGGLSTGAYKVGMIKIG